MSNKDETIRKAAKSKILNWEGAVFSGDFPEDTSVAILGIVSFSIRNKLNNNELPNITCTTEINETTNHIFLGDFPENYRAVENRNFIFLTEEDL